MGHDPWPDRGCNCLLAEHASWEYEETVPRPAARASELLYGGDYWHTGTFMPWDTKEKASFKEMLSRLIGLALDTDHRKGSRD